MENTENTPTPFLQWLLENMWLLLILGVGIYFVSYILWGWIDIALIKPIPEEIKVLYN
ncbi:MAG: hypothetical protein H0X62_11440 [Bacteroidetes bacterium]|nr:hypothetical protein [Bacteroidota bacterium]